MTLKEYNFYHPILKNKSGELHAIKKLTARENIIPIIDITPNTVRPQVRNLKGKKIPIDRLKSIAKNISLNWGSQDLLYVDILPLNDEVLSFYSNHPMTTVFDYFRSKDFLVLAIPVIHLVSTPNKRAVVKSICKKDNRGCLIRIRPSEIIGADKNSTALKAALDSILRDLDISLEETDIIIDLEEMSDVSYTIYSPIIANIINNFPYLSQWRRIILGSGAFPTSINRIPYGSHLDFPRYDWKLWQSLIGNVGRLPAFSDYTTTTPIVVENNTNAINVPPNTRYTLQDSWRVYRDESNMSRKNSNMYFHQCHSLVTDASTYMGATYSNGDAEFARYARYAGVLPLPPGIGSGNSQIWRENDINHHIVLAAREVKSVP